MYWDCFWGRVGGVRFLGSISYWEGSCRTDAIVMGWGWKRALIRRRLFRSRHWTRWPNGGCQAWGRTGSCFMPKAWIYSVDSLLILTPELFICLKLGQLRPVDLWGRQRPVLGWGQLFGGGKCFRAGGCWIQVFTLSQNLEANHFFILDILWTDCTYWCIIVSDWVLWAFPRRVQLSAGPSRAGVRPIRGLAGWLR